MVCIREYIRYKGRIVGILLIPYDGLVAELQVNHVKDRKSLKAIINKAWKRLDESGYEHELHLKQGFHILRRDEWITQNLLTEVKAFDNLSLQILQKRDDTRKLSIKTEVYTWRK